ncbi:hypothetical protein GCM10025782_32700 [Pedococcus ginsenosidimutans]|uniref:Secreted protein n=1 Tax=Pedococcus ginsenosidimutans TaxID=490570 RepID=A0ABP8YIC9_9MICO
MVVVVVVVVVVVTVVVAAVVVVAAGTTEAGAGVAVAHTEASATADAVSTAGQGRTTSLLGRERAAVAASSPMRRPYPCARIVRQGQEGLPQPTEDVAVFGCRCVRV